MSVDPRQLRDLAAETGFRAETLEKVIRLGLTAAAGAVWRALQEEPPGSDEGG